MMMKGKKSSLNTIVDIIYKLIANQFPEYANLSIKPVEKQGHDNFTYRLGNNMLIRMPTTEYYALAVEKEQIFLPKIASHLSIDIPVPIKIGVPSNDYPYPFSIYKWLKGTSINLLVLEDSQLKTLAFDLAKFLKELQSINNIDGPAPGKHNWWRGEHVSVYNKEFREQIAKLSGIIDIDKAINLWNLACQTQWNRPDVWIHGDLAIGNMLFHDEKLSAIIDFGCMGIGDPACDLVIAWTFLKGKARKTFITEMNLNEGTWLRAKAWTLWKATFELCNIEDKNSPEGLSQKRIIEGIYS